MAKVVVAKLAANAASRANRRKTSVVEKRMRGADGKVTVMRSIDGASDTFTDDMTFVFKSNVAKARRENKQTVGSSDLAPKKG